MIMASEEFIGKAPFHDIVITGLVRDIQGRKMSKSLGNGIDPIEVIDRYGADAMKFTLCYLAAQGQDVMIDMDSFRLGSRFANKIWNATRYLLMNIEGRNLVEVERSSMTVMDRWIYSRFNDAARTISEAMAGYRFNEAAQAIYSFFWNDFCDWYIEASKGRLLHGSDAEKDVQVSILMDILEKSMRLMHPFLSFITEEIYQKLPNHKGDVISSSYPLYDAALSDPEADSLVSLLREAARLVRAARAGLQIAPEKKLRVVIRTAGRTPSAAFMEEEAGLLASFMSASSITVDTDGSEDIKGAMPATGPGFEAFIFVREAIDVEQEVKRLEGEIKKNEALLEGTMKKLSNDNFLSHARAEAVEKEKSKKAEFEDKIQKAREHIELLRSF